ncbi:MAG: hypothetical protein ACYC1C_01965 [Chloroflexota bacterium]
MEPYFVYLDQNHWIYLAKDFWGKPHKPAHKGLSGRIFDAVKSDRIRLPLSTIHFIEHLRSASGARRQRLAEVFDRFSGGWQMASWACILPVEIHRAVANVFGERSVMPQPEIFGKGFLFGLGPKERALLVAGRTEQHLQRLQSISALPGAILDLLTSPNEAGRERQNAKVTESSYGYAAAAEDLRSVRKSASIEVHRRAQYAGYTFHHQRLIFPALDAIGRTRDEFLNLGVKGLSAFWSTVPSLDVDCELTLYRDRQWSKSVDPNDSRDIGHLALAIPYCDVVVSERFWARAIAETGLAEKYGTVVCTDLAEILEHARRD